MHLPVLLKDARNSSIKKVQRSPLKGNYFLYASDIIEVHATGVWQQQADDDDDFVSYAPKIQQDASKQKQCIKLNPQQDDKSNGLMSITSRQCPTKLFNVVRTLSDAQKKDVRDMGFESILELDILVNPLKLGYWVVDRLNTKSLCLEMDNKKLRISSQSVKDIFGFPMGKIKVEDSKRADTHNNVTQEWRRQYPPAKKGGIQRVYLGHIVEQINKQREGGRMFRMNMLVLIMTLLAEGITNGTANQNLLPCLVNVENISNMNWCGYLLKCLRRSKLKWKREDEKSRYTGPLLFLILFYLDSTRSVVSDVKKMKPAITFWKNEMLKKAEKEELDAGGFGTKTFARPVVEQIQSPGRKEGESTDSDDGDESQSDNESESTNSDDGDEPQPDNEVQFNPYEASHM
ncbi:hypothetical protein CTI12_AA604320 [Artemisia annua]|uniref:Uncharacterized protein n=1 Tax=Artemisia annua TaxID=35608 RepID=A0A2U1KGT1_ARTAN|nr:hypothetical protein CTI12_AA604320 [Artemisia annua]